MKKSDIQMFLKLNIKGKIVWDGMEYIVYPKHIIEACLKDSKK